MERTLQRKTDHRESHDDLATPDEMLALWAAEEPSAFAPLYSRYVDSIYRYCLRGLGAREAAEDATSAIFMKALAALPGYRPMGGTFRSWLFAIAHNVLVDEHRKRRPPDDVFGDRLDLPDSAPNPESAVLFAEAGQTVRALLARLTPDQASVVELRLAGLSGQEVAQALGRSPNTVKVAQYRAYARLRALFAEKEGNDAAR
jgi:RNA polymerase sigma-70 factor (ECF subfamily)